MNLSLTVGNQTDPRLSEMPWWWGKRNLALCPSLLRSRLGLAQSSVGPQAFEEATVLVAGYLAFLPEETGAISPKATGCSICFKIPCAPFEQHCFISLPLTLYNNFCRLCPIYFLEIEYKTLYFLVSLLSIRYSFCKTSQHRLSVFFFSSPAYLPFRTLS